MNGARLRRARVQATLLVPYIDNPDGFADLWHEQKRLKALMHDYLMEHDVIGHLVEADPSDRQYLEGEDWEIQVTFDAG